jgi:sterol 14-demethylase
LGAEIRENVHTEFAEYYQQLSDGMSHLSFFLPHAPTKAHRDRDTARAKIVEIFTKVSSQWRSHYHQSN